MMKLACAKISIYKSTKASIARTIGGTEVNANVIIPNKLMDKLDNAAARGSDTNRRAVAMADELAPNATPLVT
jgi:hypothetical protein